MTDLIERLEADLHDLDTRLHGVDYELYVQLHDSISYAINRIEELAGLLKVASCPNCNGDGAYHDNTGAVHQCQWCDETKKALPQEKNDG